MTTNSTPTYEDGTAIPEEDIAGAMARGEAFFDNDATFTFADRAGNPVEIRGADIGKASDLRYVPAAELEELGRKRDAESLGGMVRTGLQSAASGVTFGGSDYALTELGLADAEQMRADREYNSGIATTGELAGAVLPALASGGAGAAVKGAAAAKGASGVARAAGVATRALELSPAGLAARGAASLGRAAEGRLLASGVPGWLARPGALALEGAAEGTIAGVGTALSEASLGDREVTAELLLAGAKDGALLGALTGGGIGAAAEGGRAAAGALLEVGTGIGKRMVRSAAAATEARVDPGGIAETLIDTVRSVQRQATSKATGVDAGDLAYASVRGDVGRRRRMQMLDPERVTSELETAAKEPIERATRNLDRAPTPEIPPPAPDWASPVERQTVEAQRAKALDAVADAQLLSDVRRSGLRRTMTESVAEPERVVAAVERYADRIETAARTTTSPEAERELLETATAARELLPQAREMAEALESATVMRRIEAAEAASPLAALAPIMPTLGGVSAGLPGAALGMAAAQTVAPTRVVQHMARLDAVADHASRQSGRVSQAIQRAVSAGRPQRAVREAATVGRAAVRVTRGDSDERPAPARQSKATSIARMSTAERREEWQRLSAPMRAHRANPLAAAERVQAAIGPELAASAPGLTEAVLAQHARAAEYLSSVTPQPPQIGGLQAHLYDYPPSPRELQRYASAVGAIDRPVETLERLVSGGSLDLDAARALKAVYPRMFADAQTEAMEVISMSTTPIARDTLLRLGILFEFPTTPDMAPSYQALVSQADQVRHAEQPGGGQMPSQGPGELPDVAEQTKTLSQTVAEGI